MRYSCCFLLFAFLFFADKEKGIIQIIFWNIDHCIDFSILWIHQDHGYLFCLLLFLHLLTCLHGIILQIHIKRNIKIPSGNWFFPLFICSIDFYAASICQCPDPSRLSFKISIIKTSSPMIPWLSPPVNPRTSMPGYYMDILFCNLHPLDPVKFKLTDTVCDVFFYITFNFFPY